jgi:hypothetical protein
MENRRDSSVWQSLAITFGGGLALGAVGMKLTQEARRGTAPAEEQPVTRAVTLDPRLLDAVIAAVDARLHDHTAHTERMVAQVQSHVDAQVAGIRSAVGEELNQFGEAISNLVGSQVAELVEARTAAAEQGIEARLMAAVRASLDTEIAPMRHLITQKEQELAELRQRLQESERTVLDVILAIGAACQQAADRVGVTAGRMTAAAVAPPMPAVAVVTPVAPLAAAVEEVETAAPVETPEPAAKPVESAAAAEPENASKVSRLWRVPMVSSFLLAMVGLLAAHYL